MIQPEKVYDLTQTYTTDEFLAQGGEVIFRGAPDTGLNLNRPPNVSPEYNAALNQK